MKTAKQGFTTILLSALFAALIGTGFPGESHAGPPQIGRLINKNLKERLPSYYPERFMGTGIVTAQDSNLRTITIGNQPFVQGINTRVHTLNSKFASVQNLTPGTAVGFNYLVGGENNTFFLTEVWTLPTGSVRGH